MSLDDLRALTAEWIVSGMVERGITVDELADEAGIARSTVYRLKRAEVTAEESTLATLAKVLKKPYPRLISAPDVGPIESDRKATRRPQDERAASGVGRSAPPVLPSSRNDLVGLVRDALIGAVERALARDELEHTRKGRVVLGTAFLGLAVELQGQGVDTHELVRVAHELLKTGQP